MRATDRIPISLLVLSFVMITASCAPRISYSPDYYKVQKERLRIFINPIVSISKSSAKGLSFDLEESKRTKAELIQVLDSIQSGKFSMVSITAKKREIILRFVERVSKARDVTKIDPPAEICELDTQRENRYVSIVYMYGFYRTKGSKLLSSGFIGQGFGTYSVSNPDGSTYLHLLVIDTREKKVLYHSEIKEDVDPRVSERIREMLVGLLRITRHIE
jgi:hypothetical protein